MNKYKDVTLGSRDIFIVFWNFIEINETCTLHNIANNDKLLFKKFILIEKSIILNYDSSYFAKIFSTAVVSQCKKE